MKKNLLAVLLGTTILATSAAYAEDTTPPAQAENGAVKEELQKDKATVKADREKLKADRAKLKSDRKAAREARKAAREAKKHKKQG